jgi:Ca2+-binding RTX toxin-like protein
VAHSIGFERNIVPVQDGIHLYPFRVRFIANVTVTYADESKMNLRWQALYSPERVEGLFSEVRREFIVNSSPRTIVLALVKNVVPENKGVGMRRAMFLLAAMVALLALSAGSAFAAVVSGTASDDALEGTKAPDSLFAQGGDDRLNGRGAGDALFGQADDDLFVDTSGHDLLRGSSGADLFAGNPGDDAVHAGRGADLILDDLGEDLLSGGRGNDAISVAGFGPGPPELFEESDKIVCGPGLDAVDAHPSDVVANDCEEVNIVPSPF